MSEVEVQDNRSPNNLDASSRSSLNSTSRSSPKPDEEMGDQRPTAVVADSSSPEIVPAPEARSPAMQALDFVRVAGSLALLVWSFVIVTAAIFAEKTAGTVDYGLPPILSYIIWLAMLLLLAMIEGGQGALVGLQPTDKFLYRNSHKISHSCTELAHKGDNMERFIVGRQFLVVLTIFIINMQCSPVKGASVLGMGDTLTAIFLDNGLAPILTTIIIGQLTAQVNATSCMLDFINYYFMYFCTVLSLAIEYSGLLHSVYLISYIFSGLTGKPIETKEPPRDGATNAFFWLRVAGSFGLLCFSFAVTLVALFNGWTTMWSAIPSGAAVVIFAFLLCFVGMMEGMQIALFAVIKLPEEQLARNRIAAANCRRCFAGNNMERFLIGRQVCVCVCMFVAARVVTFDKEHPDLAAGDTVFGVGEGLQNLFDTGLLGALIVTVVGSLMWRVIAGSYPLLFLSNPLINVTVELCLLLESTGLCSSSFFFGAIHKQITGFETDEMHLGKAEAARGGTTLTLTDSDSEDDVGNKL